MSRRRRGGGSSDAAPSISVRGSFASGLEQFLHARKECWKEEGRPTQSKKSKWTSDVERQYLEVFTISQPAMISKAYSNYLQRNVGGQYIATRDGCGHCNRAWIPDKQLGQAGQALAGALP